MLVGTSIGVVAGIGATMTGLIGVLFPQVMGLGYGFLQYLINGNLAAASPNFIALPIVVSLVLVVAVKILATSFTVGSGGSAGVFEPSLVIAGLVGAVVWVVTSPLFPGWITVPAPLVIIGMMALFAGVGRVPIAVILMVSEMTGTLSTRPLDGSRGHSVLRNRTEVHHL